MSSHDIRADIDVRYWLAKNPICPHCGLNFQTAVSPLMNLIPHWHGDCVSPDVKELERLYSL